MLGELLQLVESTLLQKQSEKGSLDSRVLQDRLTAITKPTNAKSNTSSQLRVVDSFLAESASKDAIKKCIDQVKPFFFQVVNEKLEQESTRLLKGMRRNENKKEVFKHFLLHKANPELLNNRLLQKVDNYHISRERQQDQDKFHPDKSYQF